MATDKPKRRAVLLYDGSCQLCIDWVDSILPWLQRHNIGVAQLQEEWVAIRLKMSLEERLQTVRLITHGGEHFAAEQVVIYLCAQLPLGKPFAVLMNLWPFSQFLRWGYMTVARRRNRLSTRD